MLVTCTDFYGKTHLADASSLIGRVSAYGVYVTDGNILLIQDPRSLRWEFPGGGVEAGETASQALRREFTEEAGVTVVGRLKFLTRWTEYFFDVPTGQAWRSERRFYTIPNVRGTLLADGNGDDSAAARLIPLGQALLLNLTPSIRKIITQITTDT